MLFRKQRVGRRRGAAAVETALVLLPVTMLILGVFEYSRLLMIWNLINNGAREGCRYALANNTASTITTDVQGVVTARMGGQSTSLTTFTVTLSGTHNGVSTPVNSLVPGDMVTVKVSGQYKFMNIIPLLPLPTSVGIASSATMVCEGGT
jgi:Flp pilus assembly protein TadG